MTLQELQKQALKLSVGDRWTLLKLLIDSLSLTTSTATASPKAPTDQNPHPLAQYYGCIDDETFIRHPQPEQPERESFL